MTTVTNHIGICVRDVDRSRRFYEGLGFVFQRDLKPPDELTSPLLGIDVPVDLTAVYLKMGDFVLELLHYGRPENPAARDRKLNEPGLTHLSFTVDDLTSSLEQVRALGGEVVESSNIGLAVMVRDPDGQLLELLPRKSA